MKKIDYNTVTMTSESIRSIFSSIAKKYDLLNTLISLGLHKRWRCQALDFLELDGDESLLDVCCGTGDFAIEARRRTSGKVVGLDFCPEMMEIAEKKACGQAISFIVADAADMPFEDNAFDCVTVGFGLRNLVNLDEGLKEIARVLKSGGSICSLDITHTENPFFKAIWKLYFYRLMPVFSRVINKNKYGAYDYLASSVRDFLPPQELAERIRKAGFEDVKIVKKIFGVLCMHIAYKK